MLISKAVGFIMIPIYTHYLTPADYGVLELLTMTSDVIAMLIGVGLAQSVLRFYYNYESQGERNLVVSTALISGSAIFIAVFGALVFASGSVSDLVLGADGSAEHFKIIFLTMMFFGGIEIPLVFLRAQQRSVYFVVINLVKLIIQLSLNIYFIVVLQWGIAGVLYSGLIATIAVGCFLTIRTLFETGIKFSSRIFSELLYYGYPLIFTNLGAFILTYSDRYFLKYFSNLSEVGIYSLGYKFGMMVSILLLAPFQQFWAAEMFAVAKRDDASKVFRDFFTYSTFFSILFCFGLSLYIKELIEIIAVESYWSAYAIVPFISLAYIFIGMHGLAICGILIEKKTKFIAYSTAWAVIANIALNFALIPRLGAIGAAVATIIAFWIRLYTAYRYSQKLMPLKYEWGRINAALSLAVFMVIVAYSLPIDNFAARITLDTIILLTYPMILYLAGWFHQKEKELIMNFARHPINLIQAVKSFRNGT